MAYGYLIPTGGYTVELWFKRDALPSDPRTLVNQRTQASVNWNGAAKNENGRQLTLEMTSAGALAIRALNEATTSGTATITYTDASPGGYGNDNEWHHVAFRLGTNKIAWTLFLDGEVYASGNASAAANWKPGILTFGGQYAPHLGDHGTHLWDKWLAYPAVYNYPLTDNRIFEHYTAGAGGTVYYGDDEVTRLTRICDWAEVPEQSREFESDLVTLQGIQVAGTNALAAAQDTAEAANGLLFADGQSRIVYHNRRHRYNRWSIKTLSESLSSSPEVGMTFTTDDTNIYNEILGDRPFGSSVRLLDAVSKAAHGRKSFSFSIPVTTHEELENAVSWLLSQYRYPRVRVSNVTFRAESSDIIEWVATGGVTIGDHITLEELPEDAAPNGTMEFIVERIGCAVDIKDRIWEARFELTPFEINEVFEVGVSTLGSRYKIAY